jgi:glucose/arabinose dehydrogenase
VALRPASLALAIVLLLATALHVRAASRLPDGFEESRIVEGLAQPTAIAVAPDGRVFIAEKAGHLRLVRDGALRPTPFLSVAVESSVERGLLGVALSPGFASDGQVYVYYTHPEGPSNRVSRFTTSRQTPDVADPASEQILLQGIPSAPFHNGGALHFLPDGTLLVAVGDGERPESAQSLGALTGKLLRIDVTGQAPADNPFAGDPEARQEIWAYGLRNPFSFAVEPGSGRVLINDVGTATTEEINLGRAGANYGWPGCEGPCGNPDFTGPLHSYNHSQGCAITGGTFAAGLRFPDELGALYFFSDFCGGWIRRLTAEAEALEFARDMDADAVALAVAPEGSLYYLSHVQGALYRIEFVGDGNRKPIAAASASPSSGPPPLNVALSGADSSDPDGDALTFEWETGDGGAGGSGETLQHTYGSAGAYVARLTVADGQGGRDVASVRILVGNPPEARILSPAEGTTFEAGQTIAYSGEARDAEDGMLPPAALVWGVELHHHPEGDPNHHTHPVQGPVVGASGTFTVPRELHDEDIFFRIHLAATDSDGLPHAVSRDLTPGGGS